MGEIGPIDQFIDVWMKSVYVEMLLSSWWYWKWWMNDFEFLEPDDLNGKQICWEKKTLNSDPSSFVVWVSVFVCVSPSDSRIVLVCRLDMCTSNMKHYHAMKQSISDSPSAPGSVSLWSHDQLPHVKEYLMLGSDEVSSKNQRKKSFGWMRFVLHGSYKHSLHFE